MNMYDDLDPVFVPTADDSLSAVAARVHRLRTRRRVAIAGSGATIMLVAILAGVAFASRGSSPHRLTVADSVTSTTHEPPTVAPSKLATTSSAPKVTTSTKAPAPTVPVPATFPTTVRSHKPPSTTAPTAHLTVAFDRDRLVIQSGTRMTISYKVSNGGDGPGRFAQAACPNNQLWPHGVSHTEPLLWPTPASPVALCNEVRSITIGAHGSKTFHLKLVGGLVDGAADLVPAPPGRTTFKVGKAELPVTITPPASPPITVVHPSAVTTASNAQHWVDWTVTNNLPFPVRYVDQGPCSQAIGIPCNATTPDGSISGDMRLPPYNTAKKPLYLTHFLLGAGQKEAARAEVHGTTTLEDIDLGSPAMPPGVYSFDWDGQKVQFTVTAAAS